MGAVVEVVGEQLQTPLRDHAHLVVVLPLLQQERCRFAGEQPPELVGSDLTHLGIRVLCAATPTTRTVDTHIFQLRQKLEVDPAAPLLLRTVHGVGYRLDVDG